ncbi:uncharacterized protein [Ptychodera flava]|uniref:uncharacterized protein n=1 Tax=Ptychodera flava TaxID=63121 RepID=UPI00396A8E5B
MSPCKVPSKLLLSDTPERKQRTCMHSSKSDNHSICVDNQSLKNQRRNACSLNLSMKHPEKSFTQKAIVHCDVEKTWKEESTIHQPQSHVHDDKENFSFVSQQIKRPPPPSEISYLPYSQPAPKSSFHSSVNWKRSHLPIGFMPSEMLEPVEEIEQIEKKPTMIDDHNFESFMEEQKRRTRSYSLHSRESSPQSDSSDFSWSDSETAQESMYTDTWNKTKDTLERKFVSNINSKAEPERARDQVNIDNPLLMTTPKRPRPSSTDGNQCSSQTLDLKCLEIMSDILDDDDDSKQKEFSYPVCHTPNASTMLTESKILQGHSKDGEEKYQHNLQNMLLHRDSIWKKSTFTRDKKVETTEKTVTPQHSRWRDFIKQPNGNNRANQSCVSGSKENDPNMVLNGSPEYTMQKIMPSQPPQGSGSLGDADDNAEQPPDLQTTSKMNETVVSEDALTHDGLAHDKNHTNGKISVYFLDEPQLQKKTEDEHLAIEMKFAEEAMKEVMTLDEVINEASHPKFSVSDAQSGITDLSRLGGDLNFHIPQPSLEMLSSDDQVRNTIQIEY